MKCLVAINSFENTVNCNCIKKIDTEEVLSCGAANSVTQ